MPMETHGCGNSKRRLPDSSVRLFESNRALGGWVRPMPEIELNALLVSHKCKRKQCGDEQGADLYSRAGFFQMLRSPQQGWASLA